MRLRRYLIERIQNPPLDYRRYLKIKLKQIDKISKKISIAVDFIKKYMNDDDVYEFSRESTQDNYGSYLGMDELEYCLNKINEIIAVGHSSFAFDITELLRTQDDLLFNTVFNSLIDRLQKEYGMDVIHSQSKYFLEHLNKREVVERIEKSHKDWIEYEKDKKYTEYYKILKSIVPTINEFYNFYNDFKAKMIEWKKASQHDYVPEYENVEELYHATMYSKELLSKGFETKIPKDRIGLGGATEGVSMTTSLKIAQDISRFLKEVIMIFNGQLKYRHIVDWMKREGIDPKDWNYKDEPENLMDLAKFYEYYLWMSKMRTNPVSMWSDDKAIKAFSRRKVSDVAILKCKVDMSNPNIKYVKGEREFRVPPEAVLECKKL